MITALAQGLLHQACARELAAAQQREIEHLQREVARAAALQAIQDADTAVRAAAVHDYARAGVENALWVMLLDAVSGLG